jgi:hypothetical protein
MQKINVPDYPQFLPAPDQKTMQLYVVCTKPLAFFWIRQTIPAQIYILEGPQDEKLLKACAEWYKKFSANQLDQN